MRFERGKENSGRPRLYPCGGTGDVDEAVRAEHSSKQLRGQLRGVVRVAASSCAKFCKLQIIFRCPKLILNGKRVILPNSLKIKLNSKEIQIFELGQIRISKNYF